MTGFRSVVPLLLLLYAANIVILKPVQTYAKPKASKKGLHKRLFVFGDSTFDAGNNQYIEGNEKSPAYSLPYGQHFIAGPTGRHSDGRIVPDFIAQKANLIFIPPCLEPRANLTNGANFASAGAGVLTAENNKVMNREQQLNKFTEVQEWLTKKLGDTKARKTLKRAVYIFGFGGYEYLSLYFGSQKLSKAKQRQYAEKVVEELVNTALIIYNAGGRKFGFQNVGPLGCLPMLRKKKSGLKDTCVEELMRIAKKHNKALASSLERMGEYMPGFKHSIFDYYNTFHDRIVNPTKYGFEEGKAACYQNQPDGAMNEMNWGGTNWMEQYTVCHNSSQYIFFDGMHMTERANSQIAELMWDGPPSITQPYNLKQLFEM